VIRALISCPIFAGNLSDSAHQKDPDYPIPPSDRWFGGAIQWDIDEHAPHSDLQEPERLGRAPALYPVYIQGGPTGVEWLFPFVLLYVSGDPLTLSRKSESEKRKTPLFHPM
jgi:hypothetical protein